MMKGTDDWDVQLVNAWDRSVSFNLCVGCLVEVVDLPVWMRSLRTKLPSSVKWCVISLGLGTGSSSLQPVMVELSLSPCSTATIARKATREILSSLTASLRPWTIRPLRAVLVAQTGDDPVVSVKLAEWAI